MIPTLIYILGTLTCLGCAYLLYRAFRNTRSRLLLWSALCFFILGIANVLMFMDLIVYPGTDLVLVRSAVTLSGVVVMLYGLISESR
jgi:hypothetical protein